MYCMKIRLCFIPCLVLTLVGLLLGCKASVSKQARTVKVDSSSLRLTDRDYDASTIDRVIMTGRKTPTMIRFVLDSEAICCIESDDFSLSIENDSASKVDGAVKEITIINDVKHKRWMIWVYYENGTKRLYHEYSFGETTDGKIRELRLVRVKDVVITVMANWYDWY